MSKSQHYPHNFNVSASDRLHQKVSQLASQRAKALGRKVGVSAICRAILEHFFGIETEIWILDDAHREALQKEIVVLQGQLGIYEAQIEALQGLLKNAEAEYERAVNIANGHFKDLADSKKKEVDKLNGYLEDISEHLDVKFPHNNPAAFLINVISKREADKVHQAKTELELFKDQLSQSRLEAIRCLLEVEYYESCGFWARLFRKPAPVFSPEYCKQFLDLLGNPRKEKVRCMERTMVKLPKAEGAREGFVCFHIRRLSRATLYQGIMHPDGVCWIFEAYDEDYNPVSVKKTHMFELILDPEVGTIEFATDDAEKYIQQFPEILQYQR